MDNDTSFSAGNEANDTGNSPHDPFDISAPRVGDEQRRDEHSEVVSIYKSLPFALKVNFDGIAPELTQRPDWFLWRHRLDKGKWKKPPFQVDGRAASVTDPSTSTTFDLVREAYLRGGYHGIGTLVSHPNAGIDIDHCIRSDGTVEPWGTEILMHFDGTYTELSPSGTGYRIFAKGDVTRTGKGGPERRLEVYDCGSPRYLTLTGHRIGSATAVTKQQAALDWLHATHMSANSPIAAADVSRVQRACSVATHSHATDDEILECAFAAKNGTKARSLFNGAVGEDHSSADMSFVCLLAFHTRDVAQIDRIFRTSRLMRPKWDEKHGKATYGEATIANGLAFISEPCKRCNGRSVASVTSLSEAPRHPPALVASEPDAKSREPRDDGGVEPAASQAAVADSESVAEPITPQSARSDDLQSLQFLTVEEIMRQRPVDWLIRGVLTVRGFGVMYGEPASGKSFLALDMATAVALGLPWFGHRTKPGNVLYASCEGSMRNRVDALLRHRNLVDIPGLFVREGAINLRDPDGDTRRLIRSMEAIAATRGPVSVIFVDTLARAISGGDENGPTDMGLLIANSARIQAATGAAVVFVHHCGKDVTKGGRGHSSLRGAADMEIAVSRDDDRREFKIAKVKEGEDGDRHGFSLVAVDLGPSADLADDADRSYSCVVEASEVTGGGRTKAKAKIPGAAMTAYRALREAIEQYGERMPGTSAIPPNVRAVAGRCWRDRYDLLDALDETSDSKEFAKAVDARKKRFLRGRLALQERELVGSVNDLYWLTE